LYEIGAPAMHAMMRAMLAAPGVIGARQAGAGFGGCMVAFVKTAQVDLFAASVRKAYVSPDQTPPEVYPVEAVDGAGTLDPSGPSDVRLRPATHELKGQPASPA
jgi:galactokinase